VISLRLLGQSGSFINKAYIKATHNELITKMQGKIAKLDGNTGKVTQQQTLVEKQHKRLWQQNSLSSSQNSDTTEPSGRELYHLQFLLEGPVQKLLDTPS
jgi:TolA-binding protein